MIHKNTQGYTQNNGLVTGVNLLVSNVPNQRFVVETLYLIDEKNAGGKTVCYFFVRGYPQFRCYLGYPFESNGNFQNKLKPGGTNNEHMITNGYEPLNNIGPLSIFVADENGNCISQIIRGLGLPNKHHVSFFVEFVEANSVLIPNPNEDIIKDLSNKLENVTNRLIHIEKELLSFKTFISNDWM